MATIASAASLTPQRHLRAEIARVLGKLGALVEAQRARGRSPAGDPLGGLVIEDGEAEGLLAELDAEFGEETRRPVATDAERFLLSERALAASSSANPLPLVQAARAFVLDDVEYDALVLCVAIEMEARVGRLVAYLNDHAERSRPTIGLLLALAQTSGAAPTSPFALLLRPAVRDGLLVVEGSGPLPSHEVRVDPAVATRIAGEVESPVAGIRHHPPSPGLLARVVLRDDARAALRAWGEELRGGATVPTLLLAARPGSGRSTVARAATSLAGRSLVALDVTDVESDRAMLAERLRGARREARWTGSALLVRASEGMSDWRAFWAALDGLATPLVLAVPPAIVETATAHAPDAPLVVGIAEPDVGERARLWRALIPGGAAIDDAAIDSLAARFQFGPGRIARIVQRADAALHGQPAGTRRVDAAALAVAARAVGAAAMGTAADRLALPYTRSQLVVPERIDRELDLAVAWVRHQRQVLEQWAFGARLGVGRGLTALFSGPPGTGKTMASQVLARELGLDLYRVDLSQTVSKYIGETEKNIGRIFDEARMSGAAILFDEADALFGKRSEVKDAHDRYANVEIGYLLQRLEAHDGVVILATNRARDLDEAFVRRFHVMIDFPLPNAADRLRIWEGMFPADAARAPDIELARLAEPLEMSGGEIKNAVLAAAYLAAAEGAPIAMRHLRRAVLREMQKNGRVLGAELLRELER